MGDERKSVVEGLPPLRDVIAAHDLKAQKSLGQNFLLDLNVTDKIVHDISARHAVAWQDIHAIEIGPGPGGLTRALLKSGVCAVTAVEYDARAIRALQALKDAVGDDLCLVQGDALRVDMTTLSSAPRAIVANLPYNIATPLLMGWLRQIYRDPAVFCVMGLMFQKEVADRLLARPQTKSYGRLSIIAQWLCDIDRLYELPPGVFTPSPKVHSTVVHFVPKPIDTHNPRPSFQMMERVSAAAFGQRRKMIRSSLKAYAPALEALNIDMQQRAEDLSVQDYVRIASLAQA